MICQKKAIEKSTSTWITRYILWEVKYKTILSRIEYASFFSSYHGASDRRRTRHAHHMSLKFDLGLDFICLGEYVSICGPAID